MTLTAGRGRPDDAPSDATKPVGSVTGRIAVTSGKGIPFGTLTATPSGRARSSSARSPRPSRTPCRRSAIANGSESPSPATEETILADYSYSNRDFERLFTGFRSSTPGLTRLGISHDELRMLLVAHPRWLQAAFDHILTAYGSIETYVRAEVGLSSSQIDRVRDNLLM